MAFGTLAEIANSKKQGKITAVTVSVADTDLSAGKVVGSITVKNRSRRKFTLNADANGAEVTLMGVTKKVA